MKYKCDNCKEVFEDGESINIVNDNVGGLGLMEDTLVKGWVILCGDCFQELKAEMVQNEDWMDLDMMNTDIKYFWRIKELDEFVKKEKSK